MTAPYSPPLIENSPTPERYQFPEHQTYPSVHISLMHLAISKPFLFTNINEQSYELWHLPSHILPILLYPVPKWLLLRHGLTVRRNLSEHSHNCGHLNRLWATVHYSDRIHYLVPLQTQNRNTVFRGYSSTCFNHRAACSWPYVWIVILLIYRQFGGLPPQPFYDAGSARSMLSLPGSRVAYH